MNPNIFRPYQVIEQTKTYLQLEETRFRKIFLFSFFKVYPLLMIAGIIAMLLAFGFPLTQKLMICGIGLIFIWTIIFKKYIEEVKISNHEITVNFQSFWGKKSETLTMDEIENITIETYLINNAGGYYYRLKLKNSKTQIPLLSIPSWYINLQNRENINKTLEEITGLKVIKW